MMRRRSALIVAVMAVLFSPGGVLACLWDYDTLLMERRKFPGVVELISGKFLRHSPEFYEWRIRDRTEKLKGDPSRLDWYDDLAVAYSKTGDHKKAIEIIQQKDKLKPGLYETEANWGTFLLFDGQWEEALRHVNRALEINPDAHFGREKYQALLIEYVIPRLKDGKPQLPLKSVVLSITERRYDGKEVTTDHGESFHEFLVQRFGNEFKRDEAVQAVLGMMHFADYRSPILLEPLASLVTHYKFGMDGQRLASRAYLRASEAVDDLAVRDKYVAAAESILELQVGETIANVKAGFQKECQEADVWYAKLRDAELGWIRDGKDVEAEFERRYPAEPETSVPLADRVKDTLKIDTAWNQLAWGVALFILGVTTTIVLVIRFFVRRRRMNSQKV